MPAAAAAAAETAPDHELESGAVERADQVQASGVLSLGGQGMAAEVPPELASDHDPSPSPWPPQRPKMPELPPAAPGELRRAAGGRSVPCF